MQTDQDDLAAAPFSSAPAPSATPLKRPRPEPPSPSSFSAPKRTASEDVALTLASADSTTGAAATNHMSLPSGNSAAAPAPPASSPLRMDTDDDVESQGWVDRTGQVSLRDDTNLVDVYNTVLAAVPPPYPECTVFYLVPKQWFTAFKHYVFTHEGEFPPLDMSSLTDPAAGITVTSLQDKSHPVTGKFWSLRDGLVEDEDFIYVAKGGWDALTTAINYPADAPALPRNCIGDHIELAPNVYRLHYVVEQPEVPVPPAAPAPPLLIMAPANTSLLNLRMFVRSVLGRDLVPQGSPLRLFNVEASLDAAQVAVKDMPALGAKLFQNQGKLADMGLGNGDTIVVEVANSAGSAGGSPVWRVNVEDGKAVENKPEIKQPAPLFSKPGMFSGGTSATSSSTSLLPVGQPQTRSQSRASRNKGLVGLNNLGNTCFLASATQCLSNTHVLADYFLSGVYEEELNRSNPLGMGGQVAEAFGETITNLWTSSSHSSYSPRRLKATCSRFAPQFAGYGQHDTQEFLAFLLDGLHEDLNRIKQKPYIEKPDWKPGGGDRELAELGKECWEGYKKRNDSVIVDLFQGQLQSTLVCPECKKESITMDPFMYLTVPLPITQTRTFKLIFFPADTDKPPVNVQLLVPANASFAALKDKLASLVDAHASNIVGFDYWKGSVYAWWMDSDPNSEAKDVDTCVFHELGAPVSASQRGVGTVPTDDSVTVPVYTFCPVEARSSYQRGNTYPNECQLEPFFITLSRAEASDPAAVRMAIINGYTRLVRPEKEVDLLVPADTPQAMEVDDEAEDADGPSDSSADGDHDHLAPPPSVSRAASSASISTQNARLVPRGGLFKVHVADASTAESTSSSMFGSFNKKDPNLQHLYRGNPAGASGSWSSLDKRARIKRPMMQRLSSSISNLVSSAANSDDEGESDNLEPVIRPGEAIFVEWTRDQFDEYFEPDRESLLRHLELVVDPAIAKDQEKKRAGRSISLGDCLDEFSKQETLGQDDLWYCPVCKKHQAATKKLDIYKAPDILVICLKRFGSSRTMRDKLDHMVNFPIDGLDLDDRIGERRVSKSLQLTDEEAHHYGIEHSTEPFIYDLYAVDNHFGGLGGGHYTAFCRNYVDNQWFNYDDSRVSKATVDAVQSRAAYLLFYKRRTERAIGGISRIKAEEASRAATPMASIPSSPMVAPSVPASAMASSMHSDGPGTPSQPSPILSSASSLRSEPRDGDSDEVPAYNSLSTTGISVGYGNTAWGATGAAGATAAGVGHSFGSTSPTSLPARASAHGPGVLTPDTSDAEDDGDMEKHAVDPFPVARAPVSAADERAESGLGEEYGVVRSDDTSDAEMVSVPRSPKSDEGK